MSALTLGTFGRIDVFVNNYYCDMCEGTIYDTQGKFVSKSRGPNQMSVCAKHLDQIKKQFEEKCNEPRQPPKSIQVRKS